MADAQFYGVKYPFTINNEEGYFTDLNKDLKEKARSTIMHVVFTPKGQKLRDPEFGTDLIKYIFEPSDNVSWEEVKNEVSMSVKKYLTNVTINNIDVLQNENDFGEIYVRLDYTVSNGIKSVSDSIIATL